MHLKGEIVVGEIKGRAYDTKSLRPTLLYGTDWAIESARQVTEIQLYRKC